MKVALEFSVLRFWLFFRSVFVPKNFGFSVLMFIAVCGFSAIYHLVFGFREKNTSGISDLISDAVFCFSYLTYLGSGFSSI